MDSADQPVDPLDLAAYLWPNVVFYDKQKEVIESVWRDDETFVPAGNMLGKDFVAGFIAIAFFIMHHPCRVITTSVKDDHLRVLWGELKRFIQTMAVNPSNSSRLVVNYREIRRFYYGEEDPISYIHGTVSERGEGLAGHHAAHTLLIVDEASGVDDVAYEFGDTWAKRKLIIGNPNPCTNFFYTGVRGGDLKANHGNFYHRRVIKIKATDSPNVRLGIAQKDTDKLISDEELIPGVIGYNEYLRRRMLWDEMRQCIGLDAEFYEGAEILLYPPTWLNQCEDVSDTLDPNRPAEVMGVDPGEGDAESVWVIVDKLGILHIHAERTMDTSQISNITLKLMHEYKLEPHQVYFDRGGGGKQHADYLRQKGHEIKTVAFGESVRHENPTGDYVDSDQKVEFTEQRYVYKNRRAQMYGMLRERVDPTVNEQVFGIPRGETELRRQLVLMPLEYDGEGRMQLPPKSKNITRVGHSKVKCLIDIIGCSPDRADALVLAIYGLAQEPELVLGPAF